jgi:hypothetical protein
MKVTLNTEKTSFYFLGPTINLNFTNPGPVEVDVNRLNAVTQKQLYGAYQKGVLLLEPAEELLKCITQTVPVMPAVKPPIPSDKPLEDPVRREVIDMRKLLSLKIPVIKKTVASFTIAQVRKLLEVEKEFRNRKAMVAYLEEILAKHTSSVTNSAIMKQGDIGLAQDMSSDVAVYGTGKAAIRKYLDNIGEIVDSEEEEITVPKE